MPAGYAFNVQELGTVRLAARLDRHLSSLQLVTKRLNGAWHVEFCWVSGELTGQSWPG